MSLRIGIVGMGWVGSSVAISTLHAGIASELLVNDVREGLAKGEALDLEQGVSFYPSARVRAASLDQMRDLDAVVIAAGRGGRPGQSRLDLLRDNVGMVRSVARRLAGLRGLLVMVTNPVDVLTQVAAEASGLPVERVIGTGTMLDTARLRQILGRELELEPRSIHAQVIGEHGDSEVALWSGARIGGVALRAWPGWTRQREQAVGAEVRDAALEIIKRKGATNHAIGLVTAALLRWALRGERRVLTVSRVQTGACGIDGVALSLPAVVSRAGATEILEPSMDDDERARLCASADVLRRAYAAAVEDSTARPE
ncbi:MAG: L-lactate dehydrogenase [Myxococcota bacterium]